MARLKEFQTGSAPHEARWKPKIGLALGAGVARGWAHIGVLRALHKHGIVPDMIAGSSIGALVGGLYLAGHLDDLEAWAGQLNKRRIVSLLDFKMHAGGLIGGARLTETLENYIDHLTIQDLDRPFIAVASDLVNGHEIWLREGSLTQSLRASYALPGIFPAVYMNHRWMVDGALVNPVPVSACNAMGADMTIAVNLHGDLLGKVRHPGSPIPTVMGFDILNGVPGAEKTVEDVRHNPLARKLFHREPDHPSLFGTMVSSLSIIQDRLTRARLAGDPPDVLIEPRIGHIGLLEFDRCAELIVEGELAVERVLPKLKDALTVYAGNPTSAPHR